MDRRLFVVALVLAGLRPAGAYFLDAGRNFDLRARLYTEAAVATEHSQPQTKPARAPFQLIEHRTFFNPELDAKLRSYVPFLPADDCSFRLALWGFYDGIYDYGSGQYDRARQSIQGRLSQGHTSSAPATRTATPIDTRKVYTYQPDPVLGDDNPPGDVADVPFRINEAYVNYARGPVFLRVGRQSISWGESDTIALLDANDPFNLTLAIPGVFQDIDEARIPLWTARGTYSLFDAWGPVSSAYVETYLVPGSVDTTVSQTPLPKASPYSPPQDDPQALIAGLIPPKLNTDVVQRFLGGIQIGVYDHLPSRTMANSRFGVRVGGILARDYTTSVWYYRTFAPNPVPRFLPLDLSRSPLVRGIRGHGPTQLITELTHGLVDVIGGSTSWFSPRADGIVRAEFEYFLDEPAFIPSENIPFERLLRTDKLRQLVSLLGGHTVAPGLAEGTVPTADFLRFELGFDRFFFLRALNPTNSFTWVSAYVGQWNLSETFTGLDYRAYGQQKPTSTGVRIGANASHLTGATIYQLRTVPEDFVNLDAYESFFQTHLQTDYLHGRLTPAATAIVGLTGTYAFPVGFTYRVRDALLFDLRYVFLGGSFRLPTGFFRDRSQLAARVTLLLN